ncbi:diacylglycerol kinase family protein [Raineyella sp. W15-4]|uniref:diacylglycerol kinase family protein n=1 Tax=Raineyella sp. W15-4 TaxID=3081651 RepID=UPI002954BE28|nr:diacylglycerol kinase family protein [Raineyella sp. W15-4]WOQ17487.1 diacylglycerol kinase family protein [Raineyella sp. W15-4]
MSRPLPRHLRRWLPPALLLAYVVWTAAAASGLLGPLDRALLLDPPLDRAGGPFQVLASIGVVGAPVVLYTGLAVLAWWAYRRRLRELTWAILLAVALSWAGVEVAKVVLRMPRPATAPDILGVSGWGYPSAHLAAVMTAVVMITATMMTTRQSHATTRGWWVGGAVLVLFYGLDRWGLGAHWFSDIVGGALWGALSAGWALLLTRVHVHADPAPTDRDAGTTETEEQPRAAVIYNPTKVLDVPTFVRHVEFELTGRGWRRAIWLPTTEDDPGIEMTAIAVRKGVDLVIGAGGDGTVRVIAAGLAGTGIPLAVVPAGTGNLLARNLAIPLDEVRALETAFEGEDRTIDLIRMQADDGEPDHFCVMAGIGIDAAIVGEAATELKRAIGNGAYVLSAARHANHPALDTRISLDGEPALRTRAHLVLIGNVGLLQGGIQLMPDARADDGLLDLVVASPRGIRDWLSVFTRVLTRGDRTDERLRRLTGRSVEIVVDHPDRYELDGDPQGTCTRLTAEVVPGALVLRVPR